MGTPTSSEGGASSVFRKPPPSRPEAASRTIPPRSAPPTAHLKMAAGYVEANLMPGERIVCRAHLSPRALAQFPGVFLLLAVVLGLESLLAGFIFILFSVLIALLAYVRYQATELALTDTRLLAKVGWISRRSQEVRLMKIESIQVEQGILGRCLDYGTLVVTGTGGSREGFTGIDKPFILYRALQGQLASVRGQGDSPA